MSDTLYERYQVDDNNVNSQNTQWFGQSFTIGNTGTNVIHNLTSIILKLYRVGTPGTLSLNIYAVDGSGHPTGSSLGVATSNGDTLTTSTAGELREFTYGTPPTLSASTKYAMVLTVSGSAGNRCHIRIDASSPTYTGGQSFYTSDGTNWTNAAYDFYFEEYGLLQTEQVNPTTTSLTTAVHAPTLRIIKPNSLTIGTGGIGTKILNKNYPWEEGLIAGFTKQEGRVSNLVPNNSKVYKKDKRGFT